MAVTRSLPLEGEDLETTHWEDARHWLGVYADLLRFKSGLLDRVGREIPKLPQVAQEAASVDIEIIRGQMNGYQVRLDLWYQRVWDLQGLWVDPEGDIVRHQGEQADKIAGVDGFDPAIKSVSCVAGM